ncbi:MAG: DUF2207 domain-containing protein [Deltaproteobacteria bacterium]|nr:MAG: DUF2207 domain-containing protein [Deltaproteobacteria bacterium]
MKRSARPPRSASRPRAARPLAGVLAGLLLLAATGGRAAARSLAIERFDAEVVVARDATIEVTETIRARFAGAWNGLYRTIPVVYGTPQGFGYRLFLCPLGVTDGAGRPLRYQASSERHYRKFKIWIPDAQDAARTVVFRYRVANALRFFADHDELYWNVTGDEWDVPIEAASARIRLPAGVTGLRTLAFTGSYGSRAQDADVQTLSDGVHIAMRRPLAFHEGLTAVVGWSKGAVEEPGLLARALLFLRANWLFTVPLAVFALMLRLWYTRGRDPRLRPIVPRYQPPDGLSPAETGTLVDNRADMRDITATLVDLAVRGFLVIEERDREGLLGLWSSKDFTLRQQKAQPGDLKPHERAVLDGIFSGRGDAVELSDLKNEFYQELPGIRDRIFGALVGRGYYARRPDQVRTTYWVLAAIVGVAAFLAGALAANGGVDILGAPPITIVVAGALSAAVVFAFGWVMPARTAAGAQALEGVLGFEEFLARVESDRIARVEKTPEMFEKFLPFAMALGVEHQWARAFEGICQKPPDWYRGASVSDFRPGLFADRLGGMSRSAAAVMASTPRSAGGSGFGGGGGGGFSGGGFGGGGGGGF